MRDNGGKGDIQKICCLAKARRSRGKGGKKALNQY